MPHLEDMHCKHCGALIALIARASVKNKFGVECELCKVVTIIWPLERQLIIVNKSEYQPAQ